MNPAIIIPYRNRAKHLQQFLPYYRKLLPNAYFCVVEQSENGLFNRGRLLNIGFQECPDFDYYIFHDVDMLVQGKPDYSYTEQPTLFATNASQFNWKMPFPEYFGGVIGFNKPDYITCNGHPNSFSGWGGEDNCMYNTIISKGLAVVHRPHRYLSLPHPKSHPTGYDPVRMERAKYRSEDDGLNNLGYRILAERGIQNGRIITVEI